MNFPSNPMEGLLKTNYFESTGLYGGYAPGASAPSIESALKSRKAAEDQAKMDSIRKRCVGQGSKPPSLAERMVNVVFGKQTPQEFARRYAENNPKKQVSDLEKSLI